MNTLFDIFCEDKNRGIIERRSIAFACANKIMLYQDKNIIKSAKCITAVQKLRASDMQFQQQAELYIKIYN